MSSNQETPRQTNLDTPDATNVENLENVENGLAGQPAAEDTAADPAAAAAPTPAGAEPKPHTEVGEHDYTVDELKQALAEAKQKAQEHWDRLLRAQAEMENTRRRLQKDLEDAHKYALANFVKELLPAVDSLVLGLQAAGDSEEVRQFREGSELTLRQLEAAFAKFNVATLNPLGEPFNAEHHQAMAVQPVEGAAPNTIVNVFQRGYLLNGRLLRPALVVVAKATDAQA